VENSLESADEAVDSDSRFELLHYIVDAPRPLVHYIVDDGDSKRRMDL